MGRTYLGGAIALKKNQLRAVMRTPFLGLCFVDRSDNVRVRPCSLAKLKPQKSRYDDAREVWFFTLDLHDDDLPNADFKPLMTFLETVPSVPGAAFVASREAWKKKPDWFALVLEGGAIERNIVDEQTRKIAGEDPTWVSEAQAADLIARLNWQPASEVFDGL